MNNLQSLQTLNLPKVVDVPSIEGHTLAGNIGNALNLFGKEVSVEFTVLNVGSEKITMVDVTVTVGDVVAHYDYFADTKKLVWAH